MRASEQDRPDVAEGRLIWSELSGGVDAESLVFLDETGIATDTARPYGWAEGGGRCVDAVPHGRWRVNTLVTAVSCRGVLAAMLIGGPVNSAWFEAFCGRLLVPQLEPGQLVVLDNLSSHKCPGAAAAVESAWCRLAFLPPYSPDLNPIEKAFSKLKAVARGLRPRCWDSCLAAAKSGLEAITPGDCVSYIESCGYEFA